jgi:hypothetical protein
VDCSGSDFEMIIGLDRSFKPRWVYKILQLSKPGLKFKDLEPEFLDIIEYKGLKSKKNVLTVIKRYYLQLKRENIEYYLSDNYLHELSIKYSFTSIKPLLLFVLICKCPIAQFIQKKMNLLFVNQEKINSRLLLEQTQKNYGDRKIVKYAVGYYLVILSYFDVLNKNKGNYSWKNKKIKIPNHIFKEMLLFYSKSIESKEIDVLNIKDDIVFSLFDLSNLENVLMEFNAEDWAYQKRLDSSKIIITARIK